MPKENSLISPQEKKDMARRAIGLPVAEKPAKKVAEKKEDKTTTDLVVENKKEEVKKKEDEKKKA